jgi:S-adenosylmethionine:tRNA ribosyltransferase-isomerase
MEKRDFIPVELFDYELPEELIAKYPVEPRDHARLMVLNRKSKEIKHDYFYNLPNYLEEGDLLVLNDTKVIPARLLGRKPTGGKVEVLLNRKLPEKNRWYALIGGKKIKPNLVVEIAPDLTVKVIRQVEGPLFEVELLTSDGNVMDKVYKYGKIPIPPYLERDEEPIDRRRYQTVFAKKEGSVAAPTASLHFTERVFEKLKQKGVKIAFVTLHVGLGTFKPIKVENVLEHKVDPEYIEVPPETVELIKETKKRGKRVVAVGTTTTRTLETIATLAVERWKENNPKGKWIDYLEPYKGFTDLYINPLYKFKLVDALVTNFHLPKSSLLVLVATFAGREFILRAYNEAVKSKYRFYSYGDAMLIL